MSLVILFVLSAGNIYLMLVVVPKFHAMFNDALGPDHPFPAITSFILSERIAIAFATAGWPILGNALFQRQKTYAIAWINIGIIAMFLQCFVTFTALLMPMVELGDFYGMGENK